jgi:hypothetical protein
MTSATWNAGLAGNSPLLHARVTGLVGVLMLAAGSAAGFVASRLVVRDDIATTSSNIVAFEALFKLGIVASLVMMIAFLFYGALLYRLLRHVDATHALIMVGLVLASVPLYMLNQVHQFAALPLAAARADEQLKLFLELHRFGNLVAAIFFGLWLFPFGLLVYRSGFFPRVLGALLVIGSLGYLVLFAQGLFFPGSERTLWGNPLLVITHVSELAMMVWLLIRGVDVKKWEQRARGVI